MKIRTGIGYDVHQLQDNLPLWLGGIRVPHAKGLVGHSDADVLLHAICDALLGAAAMGDIGKHFPNSDPQYKDIDSKVLLRNVCQLLRGHGYSIGNIDSTLCLQRPKVAPYIPQMRATIACTAGISEDDVSVKATTTEQLGFEGREEGISAIASVLIIKE